MATRSTRLTQAFELRHPVVSAPMAFAAGARVGVGFITCSLQKSPSRLTRALRQRPAAIMLWV